MPRTTNDHRPSARAATAHGFRPVLVALAVVLGLAGTTGCEALVTPTQVVVSGHGLGHGRGMGQWGAYGYAVDHAWSGSMILQRFYNNTTTKAVADSRQRVYLTGQAGRDLIVYNELGRLKTSADSYKVARTALRIQRVDSGHFRLFTGSGCAGPWREWGALRTASELRVLPAANNNDPRAMLQLCTSTGTRYYRGDLLAVRTGSTIQTVNDVPIENFVRSVIAKEMSPSWADAGGGKGIAALRAQAVAARSYVLAGDARWAPWATTCDSPASCQNYSGYGSRSSGGSTVTKVEDPRTDRATSDTRLQVRAFASGAIARTEFAASSGGWGAGGDFPALPDDGDDTALNPYHSWSVTLSRAAVETKLDAFMGFDLGTLQSITVLERNGYGDMGGRVLRIKATGSTATATLTGNQMRIALGLRSDWFQIT